MNEEPMKPTNKAFDPWAIFEPSEMTEIILMVYNVIERAIRDASEEITLSPTGFIWRKDRQIKGTFKIHSFDWTMSFRDALRIVLERDKAVQARLQVIVETAKEVSYRIV